VKRFPQFAMADLDPDQATVARDVLAVSGLGLGGPYNVMLRSPRTARPLLEVVNHLRFEGTLPRRLVELTILVQARLWNAQVEWAAHEALALAAGISPATCATIRAGHKPADLAADEDAAVDLLIELDQRHSVSDAVFERARAQLTDAQIVDLVTLAGLYATTAMVLATGDEPAPDGSRPFPTLQR